MTPEDNGRITIGFRPEALEIIPEGESTDLSIPIKLDFVEELGSDSFLYGKLVGEGDLGSSSEDVPESGQIVVRSEEHTSELQSRGHLVCRLLLEKKKDRQHILM